VLRRRAPSASMTPPTWSRSSSRPAESPRVAQPGSRTASGWSTWKWSLSHRERSGLAASSCAWSTSGWAARRHGPRMRRIRPGRAARRISRY